MEWAPRSAIRALFGTEFGAADRLVTRWLWLRALALIYFSAFYALLFQVRGLVGPNGILPAHDYLQAIAHSAVAHARFWYAPSLLWISSSNVMLLGICWAGLIAAVLLFLDIWPRAMLVVCFVCFLSFVSAAGEFSAYQSDGMLLEAGFISLFFAPPGLRPGLAPRHPPSRASLFLLQWEWFRIYFESGIVKLASGDPQWRHFTAMDEYYQNGPLPTWIGWYMQHLPHAFHAFTVGATLVMELGLVWLIVVPFRRWRIALFCIVTVWEAVVISTANYAFLNYLVLCLGILLVDDAFWMRVGRAAFGSRLSAFGQSTSSADATGESESGELKNSSGASNLRLHWSAIKLAISTVVLAWIFYVSAAQLALMLVPHAPLPSMPIAVVEPFRIANQYGLFAVMTRGRYEIEFQGSNDGQNWTAYPFRYKPQALNQPPGIYAPYQPRFDWNLWFASLGSWRSDAIVPNTEVRLLTNDADVLKLFAGNSFAQTPPKQIRAVLWQYWFTTLAEKRATGNWWRRQFLGLYAPTIQMRGDGKMEVVAMPDEVQQERP